MPRRLRAFFRTRTLQGSTGQFSLSGKDAILSRGGSPIFNYIPPDWKDPLPTFTFVNGIPSSQTFSGYFTEGNGGTSTITGQNLPSGVTVNSASKTLVYDGNGAIASSATATLTADDGYEDFTAITSLVVRETAGTAGMVFKEGDIPADRYIVSSTGTLQARVKNAWPDGSAKIAVVSWSGVTASQASPATLSIGRSANSIGGSDLTLSMLRSIVTSGSVALGSYGTVDIPTVIAGAQVRTWQQGPKCSEWHWRSAVGTDKTLGVFLYVRLYENGRAWIRVAVENTSVGNLSAVTQAGKRYHAVITLNNTQRYNSQTDTDLSFPQYDSDGVQTWYWPWAKGDPIPHWSRSRWSKTFWYDGSVEATLSHDGEYLMGSKLLPWFGWNANSTTTANDFSIIDPPLGKGGFRDNWTPGSEHPQIGVMPTWEAYYLSASQGSALQDRAYKSTVANGNLMGSFEFWREETTWEMPVWSDYPTLTSKTGGIGVLTGLATDLMPYRPDGAHAPPMGFLPYLITGDYYYAESTINWATRIWINSQADVNKRDGLKGLYYGYGTQAREHAFNFRNLGHAACVVPDSSVTTSYEYKMGACLRYCVDQNILRLRQCHVDGTAPTWLHPDIKNYVNPLGIVWDNPLWMPYQYSTYRGVAPWQQHYCTMALHWTYNLKVHSSESDYQAVLGHALKFPVAMLGLGDDDGWPYSWCGLYELFVAADDGGNTASYATNWTQAYTYTAVKWGVIPDPRPTLPATGAVMLATKAYDGGYYGQINGFVEDPSYEWPRSNFAKLNIGISAAVDYGIAGAQAAYDRLKSLHGPTGIGGTWADPYAVGFHWYANWGIKPRNESRTIA